MSVYIGGVITLRDGCAVGAGGLEHVFGGWDDGLGEVEAQGGGIFGGEADRVSVGG